MKAHVLNKKLRTTDSKHFDQLVDNLLTEVDFIDLKKVVENNISHNNESVYSHTLNVVSKFEDNLNFKFIRKEKTKAAAIKYFSTRIGTLTRAELFLISAYFHDVGKKTILQKSSDEDTTISGHELTSAKISSTILSKHPEIDTKDIKYIVNLIKRHSGYKLRLLDHINSLPKSDKKITLTSVYCLPEIFLYMVADNENAKVFKKYKKMIMEGFLQKKYIFQSRPQMSYKKLGVLIYKMREKVKYSSKPWSVEARLFHLIEEVGELNDVYMQYRGFKDRHQDIQDIEIALNDVFSSLLSLYEIFCIDLESAFEKNLKKDE